MAEEQQHDVLKKRNDMVANFFSEEHCGCSKRKKDNSSSHDIVAAAVVSVSNIPDHILFEILLLLPVKSLLRCKSVCKFWLATISDPGFVAAHLDRARRSPKLAILPLINSVDRDITVYSYEEGRNRADFLFRKEFNELQERLGTPQHSNGLLLLETAAAELCVLNPSTRRVITLPRDECRRSLVINLDRGGFVERAGFGFDSDSGVYKVACYFNRYRPEDYYWIDLGFKVFTFGIDSSWRVIDDAPYHIDTGHIPASVGGAIYYLIRKKKASPDSLLLRFDVRDEKFTVVPSPPLVSTIRYTHFYMAGMEDILVLSTFQTFKEDGEKMDMWKLVQDCGGHNTWVHSFGVDLLQRPRYFRPVAFMQQGKLLLQIIENKKKNVVLAIHDPLTKSLEKTVHLAEDLAYYNHNRDRIPRYFREEASLFQVVSYVESLVSWETTRPRRRSA